MKLSDIPGFMGRSASALAADFGIPKQTLGQYLNGQRGKPSKFVADLLTFCNLNQEEIIFSDPFDLPDLNDNMPEYWMALALEAIHQAVERGMDEKKAMEISRAIHDNCG